jgi:hypothetical protein
MNLRSIPRAAVSGYLKALRWPIDRTMSFLRGGDDAARRSHAADERDRASTFEHAAEAQRAEAAEARKSKERTARQAEERRKQAAERAKDERNQAIEAKAKRDRLAALEAEKEALEREQVAVTAADEAQRLEAAAETAKASRKA